jgi:glycosyltransferase involved in cell wall biosynthesis
MVGARYEKLKVHSGRIENYPSVERLQESAPAPGKKIVYLGAMSRIRGLVEVVEAFGLVAAGHPDWRLCLVGTCRPADFEDELKALATQCDVAARIQFVPWVPYEQKEALLLEAAMGIVTYLPCANNTSCLPNKLFEYMLAGVPVIASDFPLYREVVESKQCGLLVDPARPEAVAEAMEYLVEHPEEARRMGENGRRAVLAEYNWETQRTELLHIYASVLGRNGERLLCPR